MGLWCLSLSVVPWDFLLCRSQGALLTKHQDWGGIGAGMEEILINSLCDQVSSNEGKGGPFPLGITFLLATILLSSPTYHILNYDGGWRFLMAQISEQSDLSKNLVFKRRVNHSKLSLFHPFHLCCLSHQSFLQSPTPFLENVHYLLHEDASIILFTFLNLSLIINSKLCSCLHSH